MFAGMTMAACATPAFAGVPSQADCDAPESQTVLAPAAHAAVDARAYWLDGTTLQWPDAPAAGRYRLYRSNADKLDLQAVTGPLPKDVTERFRFIGAGPRLRLPADVDARGLLRDELLLVREGDDGQILDATRLQVAGALDALYAERAKDLKLGPPTTPDIDVFSVWAPTARHVAVCLHATPTGPSTGLETLIYDDDTGHWQVFAVAPETQGNYYTYLVDVFVPGTGWVRNRVTDPYSVALSVNSTRSLVVNLDAPALKPAGWDSTPRKRIDHNTDLGLYELHVRDFSRDDATVPAAHRGKYLAFTDAESNGMRHLRALADAGVTDVHLLPVFDFATVPERGCVTPTLPQAPPDSDAQQATVMATARTDCFNWGYDPFHFNAPEGSYATDPDGTARILEFRRMVQALHAMGLRVGMDVVYNHTMAAGQAQDSVLDRIVPGYYHRLDAEGAVERSTCCANTATEHRMMAKLMRDSVVLWATQYGIDSFRFDLMGHQPRAEMEDLQHALREATGHNVPLIGEGWNFGEIADGARFVQAAQGRLDGTGIATFSDRARDAVRGGGPGDHAPALIDAKRWSNGANDPHLADLVRVGLAGTLRDYVLVGADGVRRPLSAVDYKGQPAGYASAPGEVVNYVENHDNQTLFDIGVLKLPPDTTPTERARVQLLAAATVAFSQGIAYWHAGIDVLRSKSLDRNSFDSGDAFNRLDWAGTDNGFGTGLPPAGDNRADWPAMRPLLADTAQIRPTTTEVAWMRDAFRDLLRIRASTPLFRMRSAADVQARLTFPATGDAQVIAGRIDGMAFPDAGFGAVQFFLNAGTEAHTVVVPQSRGEAWALHPVHRTATDARAREARFERRSGRFTIPARTAVVFVLPAPSTALPPLISTTLPATLAAREDLRLDIQLPPGYDAQRGIRYPVLYLDDGQDLETVRVRESLAAGYADGTLQPLILVAMHMPKDRMGAYGLSDRAAGTSVIGPTKYGPVGTQAHAYSEWVAKTLVPWVDAQYRTQATPRGRAILGWSLGGLNALNLAWEYPEVFGTVGAFSPSFWISAESDDAEAVQRTRLAQRQVEAGPPHPGLRAFFAVGTAEETDDRDGDGTIDVLDDTRDLIAALVRQGATFDADGATPGADVALHVLPGGKHRQDSWAQMLPVFLRWAYGRPARQY